MTLKRILGIVLLVLIVAGVYYWWRTNNDSSELNSGGVSSTEGPISNTRAKMDSGAVDLDGHPMSSENASPQGAPARQVQPAPQPVQQQPVVQSAPVAMPVSADGSLPAGDTLQANAPQGMAFGGSGKFQWYRQGNITWRINTQSGSTCVAFATMDEWAKPIVYTHGCGNA